MKKPLEIKYKPKPFAFSNKRNHEVVNQSAPNLKNADFMRYHSEDEFMEIIGEKKRYQTMIKREL